MVGTTVSATFGVTSLSLGGYAAWANYGAIWLTWWLGDMGGALVIAPLLLLWGTPARPRWDRGRPTAPSLPAAWLVVVGRPSFPRPPPCATRNHPLAVRAPPPPPWPPSRSRAPARPP